MLHRLLFAILGFAIATLAEAALHLRSVRADQNFIAAPHTVAARTEMSAARIAGRT